MATETCNTCGAQGIVTGAAGSPPGGTGSDPALEAIRRHIADTDDPHHTLGKVPKRYFGTLDPADGDYNDGDMYFNVSELRCFAYRAAGEGGGWVLVSEPHRTSVDLTGYAKTEDLIRYALKTDLNGFLKASDLSGYVTGSSLSAALTGYVTRDQLSGLIAQAGYLTGSAADATYLRKDAVNGSVATMEYVSRELAGYIPRNGWQAVLDLSGYLTVRDAAQQYVTTSLADEKYLSKSDAQSTYVKSDALNVKLAGVGTELTKYVNETFVTKSRFEQVVSTIASAAGLGPRMVLLDMRDGAYRPELNANNRVVLGERNISDGVTVVIPDGVPGVSRSFQLSLSIESFPSQYVLINVTSDELPEPVLFFSGVALSGEEFWDEADELEIRLPVGLDRSKTRIVIGFEEIEPGVFHVVKRMLTLRHLWDDSMEEPEEEGEE